MKDISQTLELALTLNINYDSKLVADELEKIPNIWCRLEDDSKFNWYLISRSNGKTIEQYYGYLSTKYPVALLGKDCPVSISLLIKKMGILKEELCERYSCNEWILKYYVKDCMIIDDRFLYDENIPFNEEIFLKIDEGINYINPYSFTINDIK